MFGLNAETLDLVKELTATAVVFWLFIYLTKNIIKQNKEIISVIKENNEKNQSVLNIIENELIKISLKQKQMKEQIIEHDNRAISNFDKIKEQLKEHDERSEKYVKVVIDKMTEDYKNGQDLIKDIIHAVGRTSLTQEQILSVCKKVVWFQSDPKLDFIESKINKSESYLKKNRKSIERDIKTELFRQTDIYLVELDKYNTSAGKTIGQLVRENFQMIPFLKELYNEAFNNEEIHDRIKEIRFVMRKWQGKMIEDIKKELDGK